MKITKLASFILTLTVTVFLAPGFAEDLPSDAIAQINTGKGSVTAIAYSRVTNRLAIGTAENIRIYDASTYKELMVLAGHTNSVLALAFSPNGKLLVSGSSGETVRLWNADTGKLLRTREEHTGPINTVAFSSDGEKFWTGSTKDPAIRSWFSNDGGRASESVSAFDIMRPTDVFTAILFSSDAETIVRASTTTLPAISEGFLIFVDGAYNANMLGHSDSINALAHHVKGGILATGSADKTIQLWNVADADVTKPFHILTGHTGGITAMDFSVNGKLLVSGSADKTVQFWDVATGQHLHTLTGHTGEIGAVAFLGDKALAGTAFAKDKALASGSSDGKVIIWNFNKIVSKISVESEQKSEPKKVSSASEGQSAEDVMNAFVEAFKNLDAETILPMLTGDAREELEGDFEDIPNIPEDMRTQISQMLRQMEVLDSQYVDDEFHFRLRVPGSDPPEVSVKMRKEEGIWLIYDAK